MKGGVSFDHFQPWECDVCENESRDMFKFVGSTPTDLPLFSLPHQRHLVYYPQQEIPSHSPHSLPIMSTVYEAIYLSSISIAQQITVSVVTPSILRRSNKCLELGYFEVLLEVVDHVRR